MALKDRLAEQPEKQYKPRYLKILELPPHTYLRYLPDNTVFQRKQIIWDVAEDERYRAKSPSAFEVKSKDGKDIRTFEVNLIRLESDTLGCSLNRKQNDR